MRQIVFFFVILFSLFQLDYINSFNCFKNSKYPSSTHSFGHPPLSSISNLITNVFSPKFSKSVSMVEGEI